MSNSVYSRTMEYLRNRVDVRLGTDAKVYPNWRLNQVFPIKRYSMKIW